MDNELMQDVCDLEFGMLILVSLVCVKLGPRVHPDTAWWFISHRIPDGTL